LTAQVVRRARAATAAFRSLIPPVPLERAVARCGVAEIRRAEMAGGPPCVLLEAAGGARALVVDRRIPPHTPQWNGLLALTLARTFLPPGVGGEQAEELAEIGAAELVLPARAFRAAAARTDLTMDGLRDLALRFAAPIRLTVRQWLLTGTWAGFALLWRDGPEGLRLGWRAASPGLRFPSPAVVGAPAGALWSAGARVYATLRTGRPHHGVEEVRTGAGSVWWFTRFGIVRDEGPGFCASPAGRAVLALVVLARPGMPQGSDFAAANKRSTVASGRRRSAAGSRSEGTP
jgi:hypothetical protein